jgi:hypothetical protein
MAEFDLKKALAGNPVRTHCGEVATDLYYFKGVHHGANVAAIINGQLIKFYPNGVSVCNKYTLITQPTKRTGWINLFQPSCDGHQPMCTVVFKTHAEAIDAISKAKRSGQPFLAGPIKVEWEEE